MHRKPYFRTQGKGNISFITTCLCFGFLFLIPFSAKADQPKIIITPQNPIEGSTAFLEAQGFKTRELKWDLGDGSTKRGGTQITHVFKRPGIFRVSAIPRGAAPAPPVDMRVKVLRDNRTILIDGRKNDRDILPGQEIRLEASNFVDLSIKWNFGDGSSPRKGGPNIRYTFRKSGNFRIEAVDFGGKDVKKIVKMVKVTKDSRFLHLPETILAGEGVDLAVKQSTTTVAAGDYTWEFSGLPTKRGNQLKGMVFPRPGRIKVTVKDNSGALPPLEAHVTVKKDKRKIETEFNFALPEEEVSFRPHHFKGRTIKWDFGDGTVKTISNRSAGVSHAYKRTGSFRVTAVDDGGKSLKTFSQDIRVAELSPRFRLSHLELAFQNGKAYALAEKNTISPSYYLNLKVRGKGILRGKWLVDGMVMGLFHVLVLETRVGRLERSQLVRLPVIQAGPHSLTLEFTNYDCPLRLPTIRYFVTEAGAIEIVGPSSGQKIERQRSIPLTWEFQKEKKVTAGQREGYKYEVTISETPFQFLEEGNLQWFPVGMERRYSLDTTPIKNWVYWQVRLTAPGGEIVSISPVSSFKIISTNEK